MVYVKLLKYLKMEVVPPPDPLEDYLRQWGLEIYINQFKEHAIDLETLQMLSENDIKELIPVIGHRAKLNAQIRMLRSITAAESAENITPSNDIDISEDPSSSAQCSVTYVLQPLEPTVHNPLDNTENIITDTEIIIPDTSCELFKILKSSNDGKALLLRHKNTGLLNNADRRRLCNIIIAHELKDDPQKKITSTRLYELAYDIPKIFKRENSSVYFIPYMSITPKQKINAKGKLLDCYRQRRREFIKSGVIEEYSKRRPSSSTNSDSLPYTDTGSNIDEAINQMPTLSDDVDEKLLWLNNCCYPWETVETYWEDTAKQRLTQLRTVMTVDDYLRKYKPLNQPGGVFLLLKDFKNLYPLCDDNLNQNWPIIRPKILEYCKKRQDSGLKEILRLLENDDTDEVLNTVAFMALPFLMTTSMVKTAKKKFRPSKHEVLESFICHLKSAAEIDENIQRRKDKLQELGLTLQPFVIIVGPSIKEISARYIILNHLRYEITSIVKSIDACFKIIFVLNAEYPAESSHVWQFFQKAVFNLNTKYDKVFTTVRALVTDLGLGVK